MNKRTHSKIFHIPLSIEKWFFGSKWDTFRNHDIDITLLEKGDKMALTLEGKTTGLWKIEKRVVLVPTDPEQLKDSRIVWKNHKKITLETKTQR